MGATRLIRVVLDSNILFSALISPIGSPHRIFGAWRAKKFELVTCSVQIDEVRRASRYTKLRHILMPREVGSMVNDLRAAPAFDVRHADYETDDPDDAWMLPLSDAAQADYLVTGDKRAGLLARRRVGRTRIVTAAAFCPEALRKRP